MNRMTHACENFTLPTSLRYVVGKNVLDHGRIKLEHIVLYLQLANEVVVR